MVGDSQLIYVCQRPLLALPLLLPLLQQPAPYLGRRSIFCSLCP
jgi:hypothetical protein